MVEMVVLVVVIGIAVRAGAADRARGARIMFDRCGGQRGDQTGVPLLPRHAADRRDAEVVGKGWVGVRVWSTSSSSSSSWRRRRTQKHKTTNREHTERNGKKKRKINHKFKRLTKTIQRQTTCMCVCVVVFCVSEIVFGVVGGGGWGDVGGEGGKV